MSGIGLALVIAVLLGLRHATDPDHLTAVATLLAGGEHSRRRATRLGMAWGLGHALTLFAFGVPVVLAGNALPERVQALAELAVGVLISVLAVRLLVRWRRGVFHVHPHRHGDAVHAHPHVHDQAAVDVHEHRHPESLGRSPLAAFGIGLVHGVGGSAAVGVLLVGAVSRGGAGVLALALFAGATAVSMALVSTAFGLALARGSLARHLEGFIPALGTLSLLFGAWYGAVALGGS